MSYYLSLISPHVKFLPCNHHCEDVDGILGVFTLHLCLGPVISRDFLSRLDRLQNRDVHLFCGLRKYDCVSQCRAGLRWLPVSQFIRYRSVLAMLGQHNLGEVAACSPPITFGCKHSYRTRCSPWFANIFRFKKTFSQRFF